MGGRRGTLRYSGRLFSGAGSTQKEMALQVRMDIYKPKKAVDYPRVADPTCLDDDYPLGELDCSQFHSSAYRRSPDVLNDARFSV